MTMQQLFDFPMHSVMTFDTFIQCDGNASAIHFARKIIDPHEPEKLLYLHGPVGTGKTHLLTAICASLNKFMPFPANIIKCGEISLDENIMERFQDSSPLLLDDFDMLPDSGDFRAAVWQQFNDCYAAALPIVVTASCPPRDILQCDSHLISRLLWGLVASTDVSDDDSRRMLLKKISADRNVLIADDVIEYLLVTTSREVGALIAVFEELYRYSLTAKRKITLSLVKQLRELQSAGLSL